VTGFVDGFELGFYNEMQQLDRGQPVTLELILESGEHRSVGPSTGKSQTGRRAH
jgi:hypothetical protein